MSLTVSASGITFDDLTTLSTSILSTANIANNSITTEKIVPGAVVTADIADGAVIPVKLSQPLTFATAQNATGTAIDFTGIPSWARRITIMFNGVRISGTAQLLVQIGSGSFSTSGYASGSGLAYGANQTVGTNSTSGFVILNGASVNVVTGIMTINLLTTNTWVGSFSGTLAIGGAAAGGTSPTLSGPLDRVRITTSTGTDTYNLGSVNISYEG